MPALVLLMAALLADGCSRPKVIELDYHFSMNLARTPPWFPDPEQQLLPAESDVIARRGPPDFIRFWWRNDGSFITSSDLSGQDAVQVSERMQLTRKSWIYLDSNEEILFRANGTAYSTRQMTELLKMICEYGDPSSKSPPVIVDGHDVTTWQWIEHGVQVKLIDGEPGPVQHFAASGAGTYLLK